MSVKNTSPKKKVGVLGASGYTGAELLRLLIRHPRVEIALQQTGDGPRSARLVTSL